MTTGSPTTVDLAAIHLVRGVHTGRETELGVMEAVAWLAGEPHTDHPDSASPVIATFCRLVNDRVGDEERQRLVAYIPRLVGTNAAHEVELRRTMVLADWAVRTAAVAALRTAGLVEEAERLSRLTPVTEPDSAHEAAHATSVAEETALRAALDAAKAARAAARATWVGATAERARVAERARGVAVVAEAARIALAEAAEAAGSAEAAASAATATEAAAHAAAAAWAAVATWAASVHAAVQVPVAPVDWTVALERMLDVS